MTHNKLASALRKLCLIAILTTANWASAADYPVKPIRIIVPFPAASVPNTVLRSITALMAPELDTSFVLDNKPGGNTFIGMGAAVNAQPDGYNLAVTANTIDVLNPLVYRKLPYDPDKLVPLSIFGSSPFVLIVPSQLNVHSIAELVALAKAKPGTLNYASAGIGGSIHLITETFARDAGIKLTHVPFAGSAPAHMSLMQGDIQVYFDVLTSALPRIREGKFRPLAITMDARSPVLPQVPTMAEAGFPDYNLVAWYALSAPRGIPAAAVDRLMGSLNKALADRALREQYSAMGLQIGNPGPPKAMADRIAADRIKWGSIVKTLNVSLEQ